MEFEWDENKRALNIQKHGIDFFELQNAFNMPMLIKVDTRKDYGETRFIALGELSSSIVVLTYTERNDTIRLISARRATKNEQEIYFKQIYG